MNHDRKDCFLFDKTLRLHALEILKFLGNFYVKICDHRNYDFDIFLNITVLRTGLGSQVFSRWAKIFLSQDSSSCWYYLWF